MPITTLGGGTNFGADVTMRKNATETLRWAQAFSRARRNEGGVTIIELLISITIFAVVISGVAVGMGSALGLTRNNRNRSVAANLAAREMDVVRSTKFEALPLTDVTKNETIDNVSYTILRETDWASRDGSTGICDPPAGTALAFLKVLVTVTWPNMQGVTPVKSETILAPPVGSYNADLGHLAVRVRDRNAATADNHLVTVTGPGGTYTQTTQNGCAFFVGLTPGDFTVKLNTTGYVDGQGVQMTQKSVAVQAGAIASAEFDYDRAANINVTLAGMAGYKVPSGIGLRVANTGLQVGTKSYNTESGSPCTAPSDTLLSAADTFGYSAYPSSNYGTSTLYGTATTSSAKARSFVRFNLPSVPPNCELESATLRMYVNSAASGQTLQAYQVSASWSETGLTWNNMPATTGSPATTSSPSNAAWIQWDVSSMVSSQLTGSNHGFVVQDAAEGSGDRTNLMDPRERSNDPELVLTWRTTGPVCNPVTVNASDDSHVRQDDASKNYANDDKMEVTSEATNKNYRSYVKFPLPAIPSGCTVSGATLRLYTDAQVSGRTIQAFRVPTTWTESGITWTNQPGGTGTAATSPSRSSKGWQEWSVATQVQEMYTSGNHGFMVRDSSENSSSKREQKYLASEHGTSSTRPQLVITFTQAVVLPASVMVPATGLFPYLNGYHVWGGICADADPEGVNASTSQPYYSGAQRDPAVPTNPNETSVVSSALKSVDVTVRNASGTPVSGVTVRAVHGTDAGCPSGVTLTLGSTDASGVVKVALPFGTWQFQVENRTPVSAWPTEILSPLTSNPHAVSVSVN